jgi:hypothetical protein
MGLFDTEKKKLLKDRNQLVITNLEVMKGKEIMVKDLGTLFQLQSHHEANTSFPP